MIAYGPVFEAEALSSSRMSNAHTLGEIDDFKPVIYHLYMRPECSYCKILIVIYQIVHFASDY